METFFERVLTSIRRTSIQPLARSLPKAIQPNALSVLRLVLILPLVGFLSREEWGLAGMIYGVAVLTDALDGELARIRGTTSSFGARLDPTIDKILHGSLFLFFFSTLPTLLGVMLALDALLLLVGLMLLTKKWNTQHIHANIWGKWKFITQGAVVVLLLLYRTTSVPLLFSLLHGVASVAIFFALCSLLGYVRVLRQNNV